MREFVYSGSVRFVVTVKMGDRRDLVGVFRCERSAGVVCFYCADKGLAPKDKTFEKET